jgi:hypothetical protein
MEALSVRCALGTTSPPPSTPLAALGLAKASRAPALPAKLAGSARDTVDGNPRRVPIPSRDAALPAKLAGSARAR